MDLKCGYLKVLEIRIRQKNHSLRNNAEVSICSVNHSVYSMVVVGIVHCQSKMFKRFHVMNINYTMRLKQLAN